MAPLRLAALAALAWAAPAGAQDAATPGPDGAEALVLAYTEDFARGDLAAAFARIDPAELSEFAGLMSAMTGEKATEGNPAKTLADLFGSLFAADTTLSEAMGSIEGAVLGSVAEGDSLVHVVGRSTFSLLGAPTGGVSVTTARWTGRRWWITLGPKLAALRRGVELGGGDG